VSPWKAGKRVRRLEPQPPLDTEKESDYHRESKREVAASASGGLAGEAPVGRNRRSKERRRRRREEESGGEPRVAVISATREQGRAAGRATVGRRRLQEDAAEERCKKSDLDSIARVDAGASPSVARRSAFAAAMREQDSRDEEDVRCRDPRRGGRRREEATASSAA